MTVATVRCGIRNNPIEDDGKRVKALHGLLPDINAQASVMSALSDDALKGKTAEFMSRIEQGEDLNDLLDEVWARHGFHATEQISIRVADMGAITELLADLRSSPPQEIRKKTRVRVAHYVRNK
ncbi:MAG: hypothetical protein NTU52_05380 [Actinobacteria bacterium]|nr:hypothetical protein [Actinomycetota bacterium]